LPDDRDRWRAAGGGRLRARARGPARAQPPAAGGRLMPVQPPSSAELVRIAASYGIELHGSELEQFTALGERAFGPHARLDELAEPQLPVRYPRVDSGHRPTGEDNPGDGWAW